MASLAEIEKSYYKAIEAARLNEATEVGTGELAPLYPRGSFERWVRKIDIYDLEKYQADFYLDEEILKAFGEYRHKVASELSKCFEYEGIQFKGQVRNIGSCYDGSKVGRMNEVDSLYVLEENNILVEESDRDGFYRVFLKNNSSKCEILPRTIRNRFADEYGKIISRLSLPCCLQHGGYNSSRYSGLRYNGPAATSQFLTNDNSLLTWDMTPTFSLPKSDVMYDKVREIIQPIIKMTKEKMMDIIDIHLIPDAAENIWRLSTAQMEADILRSLSSIAPVKQALSYSKVICASLKKWNAQNGRMGEQCGQDIVKELDRNSLCTNNEANEWLKRKMRYCHIWIPPKKRKLHSEDQKGYISINTAAVKHILLCVALEQPDAFSAEKNTELVIKLMKMVFNTLGNPSQFSSPHAFMPGSSIQHLSILPSQAARKTQLALDTKEQCRTLVSKAMTMTPPLIVKELGMFCETLPTCIQPLADIKCAEYSFSCCLNPLQHPCFDGNIHHLAVLVTALCNTCGGVVYLEAPAGILREEIKMHVFTKHLTEALSITEVPQCLLETFEFSTGDPFFCAIIVSKHSKQLLPYKLGGNEIYLRLDVHGRLLHENITEHGEKGPDIADEVELSPISELLTETQQSAQQNVAVHNPTVEPTDIVNPPPALPTFRKLTWDQNKRNWQGILKESHDSYEEWITLCDIWKPMSPMRITPDTGSLKYLFPSDTDCTETLTKLEIKTPGFAIATRTWTSFLPHLDTLTAPHPSHLCDILTVSRENDVCLWVIVSDSSQEQLRYMLTLGKTIKHQIATRNRDVPNFTIRCFLYSIQEVDNVLIEHTLGQLGIKDMQDLMYQTFQEKGNFAGLQRGIALLLLSQESHITTCVGHQRSVKLSAKQALTLLKVKGKRVSYVSSAPGTGKTLCGISLYREFGKDRSVYICPTKPLIQYLKYNECKATLVQDDEQLGSEIECGTFESKVCVIIDESHHMRCSRDGLKQLFNIMRNQRMFLFVFADNKYQSFDRSKQEQIEKFIHDLSKEVLGYYPETSTFTEVYRNTRKIVSFLQHAIEDTEPSFQDITCGNAKDGDGIHCIAMENLWDNSPENGLVQYLRPLLIITGPKTDTKFLVTEVAVLFDAGYTSAEIDVIAKTLETQFPRLSTQVSEKFPRELSLTESKALLV